MSASSALGRFNPSSSHGVPHWCFDRLGQPVVTLPDGRCVLIAGEHEAHEDLRGKLEAIVGAACEVVPLGVAG